LVFKPEINENNTLQFPVYLVEGDNGQLGIDLFEYITDEMINNTTGSVVLDNQVYINNYSVYTFSTSVPLDYVKYSSLYSHGRSGNESLYDIFLYSNGLVELVLQGGA
jgi:hypothetical protein